MYHTNWFRLRYELTRDYPNRIFDIGSIQDAYEFEGKVTLDKDKSIDPRYYPDHFKLLRWWEHRTIEQLLSIKYMKVKCSQCGYYVNGDIVEVIGMYYNNTNLTGGENNILFNLKGHHYTASQLEPATKEEHDKFWKKERSCA